MFDRNLGYLDVIIEVIGHIDRRLGSISFEQMALDRDELDLTAYRLSVIGEMTNKLSPTIKAKYPQIDWPAIYGMRNVIVHDYPGIDPGVVWRSATEQLRPLAQVCRAELGD